MGVCCRLLVCCPPEKAKADLAKWLKEKMGGALSEARAAEVANLLLDEYRLVPQDIDEEIHQGLDRDLRAYLQARGLSVEPEG